MNEQEIVGWLRETDEEKLEELWKRADTARKKNVGDAVHLRGLIEISNHCTRSCGYCGLRVQNTALERYRMEPGEILECARKAKEFGYGTVVLQSGEDLAIFLLECLISFFGLVSQGLDDCGIKIVIA